MNDRRADPPRRPVTRRRLLVRRIGAGVVAVVMLLVGGFGVVLAVGALGGGTDAESEPATTPAAPTTSTVPVASTAAPTLPPTTPAPTAPAPPSAEAPAQVLVVGDSDAGAFGSYLRRLLDATGVATTTLDYEVSTGLARPDFFDWPAHLRATLPAADPDIVVVTFGGNDAQGMSTPEGSNPLEWNDPVSAKATWLPEYARRAGEVMDLLAAEGRTVVWVGIPNDDSPETSARLAVQDEAVRAALATHPQVRFVDTWTRFSSGNGGWAEFVVDPRDGQGKDVRADDGFHLNQNGAEILAVDIADVVTADLRARGAAI